MARISLNHNVGDVIDDIDDVKRDLRHEFDKRVGAAMAVLFSDTKMYVLDDPHHTGQLLESLNYDRDSTELEFEVYTDSTIAPYAAIVEFGSGTRTNISWRGAPNVPPPENPPMDYPFDAPDIENMQGFAYHIGEWMREKGVTPLTGSIEASAMAIARVIVRRGNYAHPYLRPAWFDNELKIRRSARNALRNAVR